MCDSIGCLASLKPTEFPIKCNASTYIKLKKDLILYHQYVKTTQARVCEPNPNATYKSYELRQNIVWGCYNKKLCLIK